MKTAKKRLLAALLAALLTLSLAACQKNGGGEVDIPANQTGTGDFQKNMHQSVSPKLQFACETEDGIYFQVKSFAYYIDKATKNATILCGKPDCPHEGKTCNARFYCQSLWAFDSKLYFTNDSYIEENGSAVNYGNRIYRVDLDGTNRKAIQNLEFSPGGDISNDPTEPILHKGITYFTYSGILYALPLGGDIEDAEEIWGEKIEDDGSHVVDPNEMTYTLWADEDTIYFMVNLTRPNGTMKDTLFAYDTVTKDVAQVWQTPDADQVGQWETTGVSVSQWYIMDGTIYFYLSGGGFWKTDLTSHETVKLADTQEKTQYGTAIFSDEHLCILNDTPQALGWDNNIDFTGYTGGDTLYIYGMDGEFQKELSLKSLYEEINGVNHIQLSFFSGDDIYFIVDATTMTGEAGVGFAHHSSLILCCVNIGSGEITQIYNW